MNQSLIAFDSVFDQSLVESSFEIEHPIWGGKARIDPEAAAQANRRLKRSLGWARHQTTIHRYLLNYLKWTKFHSEQAIAIAVAHWQMRNNLTVTGRLDSKTWRWMKSYLCLGYRPGEQRKARSSKGWLDNDVSRFKGHLLIADFAVGQDRVKGSTQRESLFKEWIERLNNDPSYRMIVRGFSDCMNPETASTLRLKRAQAVARFLTPEALTRAKIEGAPRRLYIGKNDTPEQRARNRSVLVIFMKNVDFDADPIQVKPPTFDELLDHAEGVLDRRASTGMSVPREQLKRLRCILKKLRDPRVDDRVVYEAAWINNRMFMHKRLSREHFAEIQTSLRSVVRRMYPKESDKRNLRRLILMDEGIFHGIRLANRLELPMGGGSSTAPGDRQVHDWIARKQRDRNSVYRCYT